MGVESLVEDVGRVSRFAEEPLDGALMFWRFEKPLAV